MEVVVHYIDNLVFPCKPTLLRRTLLRVCKLVHTRAMSSVRCDAADMCGGDLARGDLWQCRTSGPTK